MPTRWLEEALTLRDVCSVPTALLQLTPVHLPLMQTLHPLGLTVHPRVSYITVLKLLGRKRTPYIVLTLRWEYWLSSVTSVSVLTYSVTFPIVGLGRRKIKNFHNNFIFQRRALYWADPGWKNATTLGCKDSFHSKWFAYRNNRLWFPSHAVKVRIRWKISSLDKGGANKKGLGPDYPKCCYNLKGVSESGEYYDAVTS